MRTVHLHGTTIRTSALGFGTASLTANPTRAAAVRMLEQAYDLGITHFDTARMYGNGQAEGMLGEFLRRRRDAVTVTTKFGLEPSPLFARHRRLAGIARRIARAFPALKRVLRRPPVAAPVAGRFDPATAARSLETSLRELGTDRVDLLLLHECTLADAAREDLLAFLADRVRRGQVGAFGVGTAAGNLLGDASALPPAYRVLQFAHSSLEPNAKSMRGTAGRALVTHSSISIARRLAEAVASDPGLVRRHAGPVGADLNDPEVRAGLLLHASAADNPEGVTLYATTSRDRLVATAGQFAGRSYAQAQCAAFGDFVRDALAPPER